MENYIQKIISVFTASKHSEKVIEEVHQWLVDKEHSDEKEAALHTLWSETDGKADAGTWASIISSNSVLFKKSIYSYRFGK